MRTTEVSDNLVEELLESQQTLGTQSESQPLDWLIGEEIVRINVVGGGTKRCKAVDLSLKSGKIVRFETYCDVSRYGVTPHIKIETGFWGEATPNKILKYQLSDDKVGLLAYYTRTDYYRIHSDEMTVKERKIHKSLIPNPQ